MSGEEGLGFVDTNVLVYFFEEGRSQRKQAAERLVSRLMREDRIRLSTQVLQELYVTLTRKIRPRCSPDKALAHMSDLATWPLFVVDYPAIQAAGLLARDATLSFWDALIVVAAARSGAPTLYTEDLNHGQEILHIQVINPFHELSSGRI